MWELRAVRQQLNERGVVMRRTDPYPDGRDKYEAFKRSDPDNRVHCDSAEGCYVKVIKQLL